VVVGIPLAIVTGLTAPVQARINGELSIRLSDGLFAGIICFLVASFIMGVAVLATSRGRAGFRSLLRGTCQGAFPWYYHAAGVIAAYYVLGMTYFAVVTGLAIYTVAAVTGQTVSGLLVDCIGVGPGGKRRITPLRLIGVILTVVAVIYAVSARISGTHDALSLLAPVGLIVLAGILMTFQHAMNGSLAAHVGSPLPGTFVNYAIGAIALMLA
jgi:transporter family-2 protein